MVKVKICGLVRPQDAEFAWESGADLLGFVFEPTSPRFVGSADWAPEWLAGIKLPKVAVFGDYRLEPPEAFDMIQAHSWSRLPPPDRRWFRVLRLGDPNESQSMFETFRAGDALVLDAYDPVAHGGTGRRVDWDLAAEIVRKHADLRVVLAGGLKPDNVAEAVRTVRPYAVDVSSGVESSPGVKDEGAVRAFLDAAKGR